jgi:hypothetical protein
LPLIALAVWNPPDAASDRETTADRRPFAYSVGLLVAFVVSMVYAAGARIHAYRETRALRLHAADAETMLWSLVSHIVLALAVLSVINLRDRPG